MFDAVSAEIRERRGGIAVLRRREVNELQAKRGIHGRKIIFEMGSGKGLTFLPFWRTISAVYDVEFS